MLIKDPNLFIPNTVYYTLVHIIGTYTYYTLVLEYYNAIQSHKKLYKLLSRMDEINIIIHQN
jgi:hypothetical protein